MSFIHPSERSRVLEYLRGLASNNALEQGLALAHAEGVIECSRSSHAIHGVVRENGSADDNVSVTLNVISARNMEGHCSCGGDADAPPARNKPPPPTPGGASALVDGHWCAHAVALLWRAHELGFLSESRGFDESEARPGGSHPTGNDFATVVRELAVRDLPNNPDSEFLPKVSISLDLSSDRLGVQVSFDGNVQEPALFDSFRRHSARTLDNLLIRILDEEGVWDEEQRRWFVNSSDGVALVLGLLNEYAAVSLKQTKRRIRFSPELLNARLQVRWTPSGCDLAMEWLLRDGSTAAREHDLIGNGPHWTLVEDEIYRLSPEASKIAALFPHGPLASLSRAQSGPLLEVIEAGLHRGAFVSILNPSEQPACEQRRPETLLTLARTDDMLGVSSGDRNPTVTAQLEFRYPVAEARENLVILPDRAFEKECHDTLVGLGFEFNSSNRRYALQGDRALDVILDGAQAFPKPWQIEGLDGLKRGLRFVESKVAVSLAEASAQGDDDLPARKKKSSSTAASFERIDWFDCHVSLVLNNATVPLSTLFKSSANDDDRWMRLDSGAFTRIPGGSIRQLKGMLGMLDPNFRLSNSIKTRLSAPLALGLSRIEGSQFSITTAPSLNALAKRLEEFAGINAIKVPKSFTGKLRPYQQQGVNWLGFLGEFKLGGILADEMGLGKTVQTLAFLQSRVDSRLPGKVGAKKVTASKRRPSLVVAPTSVIMNWWYEAQRFTPKLKVAVLHGAKRKGVLSRLDEFDLVITSYALLRVDRYELERAHFDYVILDEAQHIKNYQAATTAAAKALRSEHRLALTGTPTENRPLELWSIIDFLMPGYLGTHDFFRTHIERPILERGGSVDVARLLRAKTRPFLLRRTKAEVERDLPPKIESVLHVEMTQSQRELYSHILEEVRPRVLDAVQERGVAGASVSILAALLRLRQVCNHPNSIEALKTLPGYDSGKFTLLRDLLGEALDNGRKVLVFAQFREMLSIIRRHLDEQHIEHCYLDGATRDRQRVIDEFNTNPKVRVFLISLKAGGLGLNLTAADTVIIYDPWWNPAVENQAIDRAHRIGQDKTVHVYRLVTEDSVEQKIMTLKRKKSAIIEALVNESGITPAALTRSDIESLFTPLQASTSGDVVEE